jgi:hypothetical protein
MDVSEKRKEILGCITRLAPETVLKQMAYPTVFLVVVKHSPALQR